MITKADTCRKYVLPRGTRVRDDYGKYFFSILDYTGSATRLFADPDFDGEPVKITEEEMDEDGNVVNDIYKIFGGAEISRSALSKMHQLLYAV